MDGGEQIARKGWSLDDADLAFDLDLEERRANAPLDFEMLRMPARSEAVVDEFEDGSLPGRDLPRDHRERPRLAIRGEVDPVVATDADEAKFAETQAHDVASASTGIGSKRSMSSSSARSQLRVCSWRARSESLLSTRPTSAALDRYACA